MGEGYHGGALPLDGSAGPGLGTRASAAANSAAIGAPLEALRQQLLGCGRSLATVLEPAGQALVGEASRILERHVCRIAVVGQIKSGKSSFINALVQDPTLLPTDVTPWTTAITNLHFRQPAPGQHAAVFQFFSEGEWQGLAEGGGRIRELTHRLVPGFEPALLRHHVEALRRRAGARLGSEFNQLLGRAHYFTSIHTDVLRNYVCSGDFATDASVQIGKYSDITKTADLYCQQGPFGYPVTLTDTPGTNDPFLVRDEITRRSLESADLYIVVLTARQPLSESDVSLLRLMHGLNRERIIVFVNRIDDLSDVTRDLGQVLTFIERKLKVEFPGAHIPIVAGSALWASAALNLDGAALDKLFERRSLGYLGDLGLVPPDELVRHAMEYTGHRERFRRALLSTSGLPAMHRVVGELMGSTQAAHALAQIAQCFAEMARASESATRSELGSIAEAEAGAATGLPRSHDQLLKLEQEARVLNEVGLQIGESGKNIERQLTDIIHEEMETLRADLQRAINRHAGVERDVLIDTLQRGRAPRVWTHEGVELRRRLGVVFATGFQTAAARVLDFQSRVAPELHQVLRLVAPGAPAPSAPENRMLSIPTPTVSPLARFVALDLDGSWWNAFFRGRPSPAACGAQIEALIRSEFEPVVEELVHSAEWALGGYCATTTKWSFGICINIVQALERRREQLANSYNSLRSANGSNGAEVSHERLGQFKAMTERVQTCIGLGQQLDMIARELANGISRGPELAA